MKIFAVQTYEPKETFMVDGFFDLQEVGLYADHEKAELMAKKYNEQFNDKTPAQVVELDVL